MHAENGVPSQTVSITTETKPNGTTITTTETTFANGTMTTNVTVIDPPSLPSIADSPESALAAIAGGSDGESGTNGRREAAAEDVSGSDGQRRTTSLGQGIGNWIERMVNRSNNRAR
jgi:hypothetical protein